jgi:hypothetical protein
MAGSRSLTNPVRQPLCPNTGCGRGNQLNYWGAMMRLSRWRSAKAIAMPLLAAGTRVAGARAVVEERRCGPGSQRRGRDA